ncbi:MAG TPA: SDR family NAD(P)-dependent oxidoreductase [Candidatus Limnocylindrales bacterium]|nr:SDR family NAD(P)-dependent oxidoreductase [Candidatus Limnocylindrales bacterium]
MSADLHGRIALVTGGGRGIGRAVAVALAGAGADVAVSARTQSHVDEVAAAVRGLGRRALAITCDVSRSAEVDAMLDQVRSELGDPLILVNNAGIAKSAKVTEITDELWAETLGINVTGAFYCTRAVLPAMLRAGWGRLINMASIASRVGAPYIAAYAASKHALLGLTRAVAAEVVSKGVTVNAICPGYVDTDMTAENVARIKERTGRPADEVRGYMERTSPQGRLMSVDEIAAMALFLCSEDARGITGQGIVIDGGGVQA